MGNGGGRVSASSEFCVFGTKYRDASVRREINVSDQPVVRSFIKMPYHNHAIDKKDAVIQIIAAAPGGVIKGENSIQRIAYLLEVAKVGYGFNFQWKKATPFCEELQKVIDSARYFKNLKIIHTKTKSGVRDVIYKTFVPYRGRGGKDDFFKIIVSKAAESDPKHLDLVATAAFHYWLEDDDPWDRVKRLKFNTRYGDTLKKSQKLYERLQLAPAFAYLPEIPISAELAAQFSVDDVGQTADYSLICSGEW